MTRITRVLLAADGALSLAAAALALAGAVDFGLDRQTSLIMSALFAVNGIAFMLSAWFVLRGFRWVDVAVLAFVLFNTALIITDEIGVVDVAAAALNLAIAGLLTADKLRRPVGPVG